MHCDASRWDTELRARVSAILQVRLTLQVFKQCQILYGMRAVRLLGLVRSAISAYALLIHAECAHTDSLPRRLLL